MSLTPSDLDSRLRKVVGDVLAVEAAELNEVSRTGER
jgi:hypothetical protein